MKKYSNSVIESDVLAKLIARAKDRSTATAEAFAASSLVWQPGRANAEPMYRNENRRLAIDFTVERLGFADCQTLDPRIVRIAPGARNEYHRHAHETVFVVLQGQGEVLVGERRLPVAAGQVVYVPRWLFHQSQNTSADDDLVMAAITDFGFTRAVLGDYDKRTRMAAQGDQVESSVAGSPGPRAARTPKRGLFASFFGRFFRGTA